MQALEQRKKNVPGTRDIITQIRSMSDKIQRIESDVKEILDKISAINEESRSKSPRGGLQNELRELNDVIKSLKAERKENYNHLETFKGTIDSLKETNNKDKGTINIKSSEDIEKSIEQLNLRLIVETITPKDEKLIASELLALRTMRSKLGGIEDNMKQMKTIDGSLKECKTKIAELSQLIAEKVLARDNIKAELDKLSSSDKVKTPEILKLEERITALRNEKQVAIDFKNVKKEEIRTIEAEFAKFEQAFGLQQKLEDKKTAIKKTVGGYKNQKEDLLNEVASFDPKIFDSLSYTISNLKDSKSFNIDIDLVSTLLKYNIAIPTNKEEVEKTLDVLKEKRNDSMSIFKARRDDVSSKISDLDLKIEEENAKLEELPPTDYDLLRKGLRLRRFN